MKAYYWFNLICHSKKTVDDPSKEIDRLKQSLDQSNDELKVIRAKAAESLGEEEAQVFDAHMMIFG